MQPFGNWAAETGVAWKNLDALNPKIRDNFILNWYDLQGKWKWERFILRIGQFIVFDLHDAGSGLLVAKCKLPYTNIMYKHLDTKTDIISVFLEFIIANEYGGGTIGGVARLHLDLSVNTFIRPKKSTDYWEQHRIEHWKTFPVPPISTGTIRRKYKEVTAEYDRQTVIHPCFYGFRVRWRGNQEDESRFLHPLFTGFTLTKQPIAPKLARNLLPTVATRSTINVNPWRWDPLAASLGKCAVCTDGVSGCPRCFMYPVHPTGVASTAEEFEFDPNLEREKLRRDELKLISLLAEKSRLKLAEEVTSITKSMETIGSLISQVSSKVLYSLNGDKVPSRVEKEVYLHTGLTNFRSMRFYRNEVQQLCKLYVKVMPAGYVRRFLVSEGDTVFHLYNMFNAHSNLGNSHSSMIVLPTIEGMFELRKELSHDTDEVLGETRGRDTMGDYGLIHKGCTVVMLYFSNYKPLYVPSLLSTFFEKNTTFVLPKLRTFNSVEQLPESVPDDVVQKNLKMLIDVEYSLQQKEVKQDYIRRGFDYNRSAAAQLELTAKMNSEKAKQRQKEKLAEKLRLESQLKGLSGPERAAAKRALKARDLLKKRSVLNEEEKLVLDQRRLETALRSRKSLSRRVADEGTDAQEESEWETTTDDDASRDEGSSSDSSDGEADEKRVILADQPFDVDDEFVVDDDDDGPLDIDDIDVQEVDAIDLPVSARSSDSASRFYVEDDDSTYFSGSSLGTFQSSSYTGYSQDSSYYSSYNDTIASSSQYTASSSQYTASSSQSTASSSQNTASSSQYTSSSSQYSSSYHRSRTQSSDETSSYHPIHSSSDSTASSEFLRSSTGSVTDYSSLAATSQGSSSSSVGTSSNTDWSSSRRQSLSEQEEEGSSVVSSSAVSSNSPPYHTNASLHSIYSAYTLDDSENKSSISSLFSGLPASASASMGSYSTVTSIQSMSSTSSLQSSRSSTASSATRSTGGGLFTYRSALDSDFTITPRTEGGQESGWSTDRSYSDGNSSSYSSRASSATGSSYSSRASSATGSSYSSRASSATGSSYSSRASSVTGSSYSSRASSATGSSYSSRASSATGSSYSNSSIFSSEYSIDIDGSLTNRSSSSYEEAVTPRTARSAVSRDWSEAEDSSGPDRRSTPYYSEHVIYRHEARPASESGLFVRRKGPTSPAGLLQSDGDSSASYDSSDVDKLSSLGSRSLREGLGSTSSSHGRVEIGTSQYGSTSLRSKFEKLKSNRVYHHHDDKSSKSSSHHTQVEDVPRYYSDGSEVPTELAQLAPLPKIEVIVKEGERDPATEEAIAGKKKKNETLERRSRIIKAGGGDVATRAPLRTDLKEIPVTGIRDDRIVSDGSINLDVPKIDHSDQSLLVSVVAEDEENGSMASVGTDSVGTASVGRRKSRFVEQHRKHLLHASMSMDHEEYHQ
jgi:hypothetical protein